MSRSWEQMEWAITGDITTGTVDTEQICYRYLLSHIKVKFICLSPVETRVLFPTTGIDWSECVEEMCPKYRRVLMIMIIMMMTMMMMMNMQESPGSLLLHPGRDGRADGLGSQHCEGS